VNVRRKIGLALGGGGARGLAHIGVLKVLQQEMIPIDMIAGTSAGALIGAMFAQDKDVSIIESIALQLNKKKLLSLVDFALHRSGFVGGRKVGSLLKMIMGHDVTFEDLKIPLACVASDLAEWKEIVIDHGSVLEAVRASISIPGIFTVFKWKNRFLIDGGIVNPVPVNVTKRMGADFIIAVDVMPTIHADDNEVSEKRQEILKEPNIFSVLVQAYHLAQSALTESCIKGADIVIRPNVGNIGFGDFFRAREFIEQGKIAARDSISEIKKRLEIKEAIL